MNEETQKGPSGTPESGEKVPKLYDLSNNDSMVALFLDKLSDEEIQNHTRTYLVGLTSKHSLTDYKIVLLYDERGSIGGYEASRIYDAISQNDKKKDILLLLNSTGGEVGPAYLISKTCKTLAKQKFIVCVPRRAKSAATLLALGADEIHMGLMSELGPIDPQIGHYPALGLRNSLDFLANLVSSYPGSSDMFAKYLSTRLPLQDLGYSERVTESAVQYAERLLGNKTLPNNQTPRELAMSLVHNYKDHGFVIDIDEAISLLGPDIIKKQSVEYLLANDIYRCLSFLDLLYSFARRKGFTFVGAMEQSFTLRDLREQ